MKQLDYKLDRPEQQWKLFIKGNLFRGIKKESKRKFKQTKNNY